MSRDPQTPEEGSADGFTWAERAELHQRIMNLRADQAGLQPSPLRLAYRDGHRDARHAAAELVAALPVVGDVSAAQEIVALNKQLTKAQQQRDQILALLDRLVMTTRELESARPFDEWVDARAKRTEAINAAERVLAALAKETPNGK